MISLLEAEEREVFVFILFVVLRGLRCFWAVSFRFEWSVVSVSENRVTKMRITCQKDGEG